MPEISIIFITMFLSFKVYRIQNFMLVRNVQLSTKIATPWKRQGTNVKFAGYNKRKICKRRTCRYVQMISISINQMFQFITCTLSQEFGSGSGQMPARIVRWRRKKHGFSGLRFLLLLPLTLQLRQGCYNCAISNKHGCRSGITSSCWSYLSAEGPKGINIVISHLLKPYGSSKSSDGMGCHCVFILVTFCLHIRQYGLHPFLRC